MTSADGVEGGNGGRGVGNSLDDGVPEWRPRQSVSDDRNRWGPRRHGRQRCDRPRRIGGHQHTPPSFLRCRPAGRAGLDRRSSRPPASKASQSRMRGRRGVNDLFFVGTVPVPGNDLQSVAQKSCDGRGAASLELSWPISSQLSGRSRGRPLATCGRSWGCPVSRRRHRMVRADDEMQALLTAQHPGYAAVPYAVRVVAGTIG